MRALIPGDPSMLHGRRLLKVGVRRDVPAPPAAVWNVISDHSTWTNWHQDYDRHEALTGRTRGVGARFATHEWILRFEVEMVRWDEGAVIGWTIVRAKGLGRLVRRYYSELAIEPVEGDPDSCQVHYRVAFTGTWMFWLLCAYTIGYSLSSIYFDARSSLSKLAAHVQAGPMDPGDPPERERPT